MNSNGSIDPCAFPFFLKISSLTPSMKNKIHFYLPSIDRNIIGFAEIWREYMGVEGLDLTPELVIPNNNLEGEQIMLLVDEDVTTCVEVKSCGNKGKDKLYHNIHRLNLVMSASHDIL